MRRAFVIALAFALLLPATTVRAQDDSSTQAAIRQVIESQLAAFQQDNAAEAFSYASPTIQRKFGDPATFMRMVRQGYAAVYRPQSVSFRDLRRIRGRPTQEVVFVGPDGRAVLALYFMERQDDGRWRIDGVQLMELPEQSV